MPNGQKEVTTDRWAVCIVYIASQRIIHTPETIRISLNVTK